jgi:cell division transport system ATP-binding protein
MIRFDHITKQYPGTNRPALNSIDVEILRGEFVFLVGASGSGKSSCLRLVLKEEKPTSGSIHVLGQDLRSISNRKVPYFRRNLGVVFQDFRLLPNKSVYDNVAFSLQVIGKSRGFIQEAVPDTLKMVGLAEKAQRLPHELSGGEQQRVAIARAIVNKPQILLADEPTGNLDPTTSAGIMALLERINAGGTTVMMATHEAGIVDQMQRRVIELVSGQIVRDERQGGYTTTSIPLQQPGSMQQPGSVQPGSVQSGSVQSILVQAGSARQTDAAREQVQVAAFATATASPPAETAPSETAPSAQQPTPPAPPTSSQQLPTPSAQPAPAQRTPAQPASAQSAPTAPTPARPLPDRPAPVAARFAPPAESVPAAPLPTAEPGRTTAADSGMPIARTEPTDPVPANPAPVMARPVVPAVPAVQHDVTEQLTLAEKLGLRAPGERPDQTGEQNVGPTR